MDNLPSGSRSTVGSQGSGGYYQVGGFRGQIKAPRHRMKNEWDHGEKPLSEILTGYQSPLEKNERGEWELMLGVKDSGASYLLTTVDQAEKYSQMTGVRLRPQQAIPADEYKSLSPISFKDAEQLQKMLRKWRHKGKDYDTSDANISYRFKLNDAHHRAEYELNRVLHALALGKLGDVEKYDLQPGTCLPTSSRFLVFCHTVWDPTRYDKRSQKERLESPKVLDVAWAEAELDEGSTGTQDSSAFRLKDNSVEHFAVEEYKAQYQGAQRFVAKMDGSPGPVEVEMLRMSAIKEKFQEFLGKGQGQDVLLVFNEKATMKVFEAFGVEVPRCAPEGVRALLPRFQVKSEAPSAGDYDRRQNRARSRSQSPIRLDYGSTETAVATTVNLEPHDPRIGRERFPSPTARTRPLDPRRVPDPHRLPSPSARPAAEPYESNVHRLLKIVKRESPGPSQAEAVQRPLIVIDILPLFLKMRRVNVSYEPDRRPFDVSGPLDIFRRERGEWSAALEMRLVFESWKSMASGSSIDQRFEELQNIRHAEQRPAGAPVAIPHSSNSSNDPDYDVNDEEIPPQQPASLQWKPVSTAMDGFDPDEGSDDDWEGDD